MMTTESTHSRILWFLLMMMMISLINKTHCIYIDIKNLGAKADGRFDNSKVIMAAWEKACESAEPSTVIIRTGTYMVGPVTFQGPCKAPISIRSQGTLIAPVDINKLKSQDGWIIFQSIDDLMLSGGTFDGQGSVAWSKNNCAKTGKCNSLPINIRFNRLRNSTVQHVTSRDSKLFHMNILSCQNLTLRRISITAPENSLNTDGIHMGRSTGVTIRDSNIMTGDDCVSLGDGSQQVLVEKVRCGPGHGISVGSLGKYHDEQPVAGVTVRDCTFINTMFGVRIKTWPASPNGLAQNMHFENLAMKDVGTPILVDQEYCPYSNCDQQAPSRVKISDVSFKGIRGTSSTKLAVKVVCSRGMPCQNVEMTDINLVYTGKDGAAFSHCANVSPRLSGHLEPPACTTKSYA